MSHFSKADLMTLTETRPGWHVSMFLPMHQAGVDTLQNPVRLKNVLRQAEEQLQASGLRAAEITALLAPAQELLPHYAFWQHQSAGLALFLAPDLFQTYCLPLPFTELLVVNQRFHLKPLLPLLSEDGQFYVLALSQKQRRLLQCTRHSVTEIALPDVPESLDEALQYNDPERQLQFHTQTQPFGHPHTGERGAIFFGSGVGSEDPKEDITEYFRQIDRGLHEVLRTAQAPLVLAGVEYLLPLYKGVTSYAHVVEAGVTGSPDGLRAEELQAQAWALVKPLFRQHREEAVARYQRYAGTGLATQDLKEVLLAAYHGRVELLFVASGVQQWGTFEPHTQEMTLVPEPAPEYEELLDTAALQTLRNSGTVYAVAPDQMPNAVPLAAVLRY